MNKLKTISETFCKEHLKLDRTQAQTQRPKLKSWICTKQLNSIEVHMLEQVESLWLKLERNVRAKLWKLKRTCQEPSSTDKSKVGLKLGPNTALRKSSVKHLGLGRDWIRNHLRLTVMGSNLCISSRWWTASVSGPSSLGASATGWKLGPDPGLRKSGVFERAFKLILSSFRVFFATKGYRCFFRQSKE